MKAKCSATIFHVSNVEISTQYYTQVLGFRVDFRYRDLVGLESGAVMLYLSGAGQDVKKAIGEGMIYIFCDEVDQYYEHILSKGALLEVAIDNRPYGSRDFAVKDPDGNILTFGIEV